jgi:hypothetical protein
VHRRVAKRRSQGRLRSVWRSNAMSGRDSSHRRCHQLDKGSPRDGVVENRAGHQPCTRVSRGEDRISRLSDSRWGVSPRLRRSVWIGLSTPNNSRRSTGCAALAHDPPQHRTAFSLNHCGQIRACEAMQNCDETFNLGRRIRENVTS